MASVSIPFSTTGTVYTTALTDSTFLVTGTRGSNGVGTYICHRGSSSVTEIATAGSFGGSLAWSGNDLEGTSPGAGNVTWSIIKL